jgi:hypothetical protein
MESRGSLARDTISVYGSQELRSGGSAAWQLRCPCQLTRALPFVILFELDLNRAHGRCIPSGALPFVCPGFARDEAPQIFLVLLATSGHARPPLFIHHASVGVVRWCCWSYQGTSSRLSPRAAIGHPPCPSLASSTSSGRYPDSAVAVPRPSKPPLPVTACCPSGTAMLTPW